MRRKKRPGQHIERRGERNGKRKGSDSEGQRMRARDTAPDAGARPKGFHTARVKPDRQKQGDEHERIGAPAAPPLCRTRGAGSMRCQGIDHRDPEEKTKSYTHSGTSMIAGI